MSYLANIQLPYWHTVQSRVVRGLLQCWSYSCSAAEYNFTKNQPTMDALVDDQESIVSDSAANPFRSVVGD